MIKQTPKYADSITFKPNAYGQELHNPLGNHSWSDESLSSNKTYDLFLDHDDEKTSKPSCLTITTHTNACTVSHLGIGIAARTAAALLNVISTTTTSSANSVSLVVSLTERRSTLSLQYPYNPLSHTKTKNIPQQPSFHYHTQINKNNHLPSFITEYSNTLTKPESSTVQSSPHSLITNTLRSLFTTISSDSHPFQRSLSFRCDYFNSNAWWTAKEARRVELVQTVPMSSTHPWFRVFPTYSFKGDVHNEIELLHFHWFPSNQRFNYAFLPESIHHTIWNHSSFFLSFPLYTTLITRFIECKTCLLPILHVLVERIVWNEY